MTGNQVRRVIISGASSGIGFALADRFASLGFSVIAIARRQSLLKQLQKLYPTKIIPIIADITKPDERLKIRASLSAEDTGTILIHNAGMADPHLIETLSEQDFDNHCAINMKAPLFLTQSLLPHLKDGGRILNISSGLAHTPIPGMSAYGMSKAALLMMKNYFNAEFNSYNIRCGSAMPGVVDTAIQTQLRTCDSHEFPAVSTFHGFFQRDELLKPQTAAKFLSWVLLHVDDEQFTQGDWNIYDIWHHPYWAKPSEIKPRQKTAQELEKELQQYLENQRVRTP